MPLYGGVRNMVAASYFTYLFSLYTLFSCIRKILDFVEMLDCQVLLSRAVVLTV